MNWNEINFKIRDGVFLKKICDENVLFAVKDASKYCRHIQEINETAAYLWTLLSENSCIEETVKIASHEFEVSSKEIETDLNDLLDQLYEYGYIMIE